MKRLLLAISFPVVLSVAAAYIATLNFPAVVVQAWLFGFDRSLTNGLLLAGAIALSLFARDRGFGGYFGGGHLLARWHVEAGGRLERIPIESLNSIVPAPLLSHLRQPFSWWRNPTEWIVCLAPNAPDRSSGEVVTYRVLMRVCVTFLPDQPERLTLFQRFGVLRAALHCARGSAVADREGLHQAWLWSLMWLAVLAAWSPLTAAPLVLLAGTYWRLHVESDWLRKTTGDVLIRDESSVDAAAADVLTETEVAELDAYLGVHPFEDRSVRERDDELPSALQRVLMQRYVTSVQFSGGVRTLALRDRIQRRLDPVLQNESSHPARLSWDALVPALTPLASVAAGACVAICDQRHTPWRLWTAGVLVLLLALQAALSWRYVYRARRRLLNAIRMAAGESSVSAKMNLA